MRRRLTPEERETAKRRCRAALMDGCTRTDLLTRFGVTLVDDVLASLTEEERASRRELLAAALPEDRQYARGLRRRSRERQAAREKPKS